ncbi:MAG: hypothetical protein NTX06_09630 [Proteobacteria bacterium]|nr:hypothetical protein [Pseudomonadota bacterium]
MNETGYELLLEKITGLFLENPDEHHPFQYGFLLPGADMKGRPVVHMLVTAAPVIRQDADRRSLFGMQKFRVHPSSGCYMNPDCREFLSLRAQIRSFGI